MRSTLTVAAILLLASHANDARAEEDAVTWLAGPVFGISWSKSTPAEHAAEAAYRDARGFVGLEAGVGWWMERLNFGISNRGGRPTDPARRRRRLQ